MGKPGRPVTYYPVAPVITSYFGRHIVTCPRCNYVWIPRGGLPSECPSCRIKFKGEAKIENIDAVWHKLITGRLF